MPILKILPDAISNTASFVFGNVTTTSITANGVDLGATVAAAFNAANTVSPLDSYARQTANAAFDYANTAITTAGGTITGNLTVNAVTANTITANGTNLGTAVAEAFLLANNAAKSTTSNTAPANPKVGDSWFDTVTNVLLRYTNDGVSNNWIDISGPQNTGFIYQSYSLTPNTSTINETTGNTVIYTVATTNTADNTVLYWTNSGTTTAADFSDSVSNGTVTITNNSGTITRKMSAESVTEGSETIILSLRTGSNTGPVVAVATTVTVEDTSLSPEFKLFSFGQNDQGGLGQNDTVNRSSPTQVGTAINWSKVINSQRCTMGIKTDGTLWVWGYNNSSTKGQLGLNTVENVSSPTQVGTSTWSDICLKTTFGYAAAAIKSDGTLWTWGENDIGQLGRNNVANASSPVQIGSLTNWSKVAVGFYHMMATRTDGTLWVWGNAFNGQLGLNQAYVYGQPIPNRSSPVQVGSDTTWSFIDAGQVHNFATKTDGTLWTWGNNSSGQHGRNDRVNRSSPIQVGSGTDWSKISTGSSKVSAIKTDGTLWVWGNNYYGQLGLNDDVYRSSPVQIGSGTNWYQSDCGDAHMVAIKTDNTLWSWGNNPYGQLGRNDGVNRSSPVQIGSGTNWYQASAGINATVVIGN